MGGTRRERLRAELTRDIKSSARRLLVAEGVEAVTLAAIARELGITAPALYRYFPGRDRLVESLAVDLTAEMIASLRDAGAREAPKGLGARLRATTLAYREWAVAHRVEFGLLFGAPTTAAGTAQRAISAHCSRELALVFGEIFVELWNTRPYPVPADTELDADMREQFAAYGEATGVPLPVGALIVMLDCWRPLYGAVCLEAFGHLGMPDQRAWFAVLVDDLVSRLGLDPNGGLSDRAC